MTGKTNSANKKIELEEITVNPGASDVVRIAEDGKGFSKVTVPGDTDLIPVNIREGIDIFGILGALKEGIGISDFGCTEYAIDEFTPTQNQVVGTVAHSLGKIPEVVIVAALDEITAHQHLIRVASFRSTGQSDQYVIYQELITTTSPATKIVPCSFNGSFSKNNVYLGTTSGNLYFTKGKRYAVVTMA